ncbi:MAG: hypothetical protein H8E29_02305 [Anaerolineales bacterium]|uniref:Uncharacterized protein n=1 Tax=Candidatus Desulfolinea nitratireducens TaxID=2841698 RepID=A0A8J6NEW4_9CHLR|nr:hypothetical protein [Candidatus Desulfolinea nitratireducens]
MATINTSFPDFFAGAALVLSNSREQPEIAASLDVFGYDAVVIQTGQALLDTARGLYDAQIKEYGEQHAATQTFLEASAQADKAYAAHRRLARIAFKSDPQRGTDLHLNDRKPRAFNPWYEQARHFYSALLADTAAQTQLARYKITPEKIQSAQALVEETFALNSAQEAGKGESQDATQQRNTAIKALDEWLGDFRVVARIALADTPQLLEALFPGG